jgi:hypothetical protein
MSANGRAFRILNRMVALSVSAALAVAFPAEPPAAVEMSTYLGGSKTETPYALALSSTGEVLIAGSAPSKVIGTPVFPVPAQMESLLVGGSLTVFSPATLTVSTPVVLGSGLTDAIRGLAVDRSGNIFVAGTTSVVDLAVSSAAQPQYGGGQSDAFVARLTPDGQSVVWLTYLGGAGADGGWGIDVDAAGNAYVAGFTTSADFPGLNASEPPAVRSQKAFLAKYSAAGELLSASVFGGSLFDLPTGVKLDAEGNIYVFGSTASPDFPLRNGLPNTCTSAACAFVTKFSSDALTVIYSTTYGSYGATVPQAAAIDATGALYLAGETSAPTLWTRSALQPAYNGYGDGFLLKLSPGGDTLVFATYLGGSGADAITGLAVDSAGNIHIAGYTSSADIPNAGETRTANDAFYATLSPGATSIARALVFGGAADDSAQGIVIDRDGGLWVSGYTKSEDFPLRNAPQPAYGGAGDLFLVRIAAAGQ